MHLLVKWVEVKVEAADEVDGVNPTHLEKRRIKRISDKLIR